MKNNRLLITLQTPDGYLHINNGAKESTRCTSVKGAEKQLSKYNKKVIKTAIFKDKKGVETIIK